MMRGAVRWNRWNRYGGIIGFRTFSNDNRFGSKQPTTALSSSNARNRGTITNESGLSQFMTRVYTRSAAGLVSSIGISCLLIPIGATHPITCLAAGVVVSFGSILGINLVKPEFKSRTEQRTGEIVHYSENPTERELCFGGLSIGMGVMLSPMMDIVAFIDPAIIPASLLITSGILGGGAYISSVCASRGISMNWRGPLYAGVGTLIVTQLIGLGSSMMFGPGMFSAMLHNVDVYGGIGLFTLFAIYDSHIAREMYRSGEADDLECAVQIYLDGMNLLIRIMELLSKAKKN